MEIHASNQINVYRKKSKVWSTRAFKVFIDDKKVGKLYNGDQYTFFVTPGKHSIYIKWGRTKSETLTLQMNSGQTINIECGAKDINFEDMKSLKDIKTFFHSIKDILYLIQVPELPQLVSSDNIIYGISKTRLRSYSKRLFLYFFLIMTLLGLFGFFNGFLTAWNKAFWVSSKTELPLGDLSGVAVDSKGNVYCVANFYYRIQKYAPDGTFLKGWSSQDNNPRIRVNEYDQLESANDNRTRSGDYPDTLSTYDSEGNLISEEVVDNCYAQFGEECERLCRITSGDIYIIHNKWLWPHIVKKAPSGNESIVIDTPLYLWLILGPFPSWIFFAFGLICFWKVVDKM